MRSKELFDPIHPGPKGDSFVEHDEAAYGKLVFICNLLSTVKALENVEQRKLDYKKAVEAFIGSIPTTK